MSTFVKITDPKGVAGYAPGTVVSLPPFAALAILQAGRGVQVREPNAPTADAELEVGGTVVTPEDLAELKREELGTLTTKQLRALLEEQGQPIAGTKKQLIARLLGEEVLDDE